MPGLPPSPSLPVGFDKPLNAAVKGLFHVVRKRTRGKFTRPQVAPQTFAAFPLLAARDIGATTPCLRTLICAL